MVCIGEKTTSGRSRLIRRALSGSRGPVGENPRTVGSSGSCFRWAGSLMSIATRSPGVCPVRISASTACSSPAVYRLMPSCTGRT